MKMKNCEENVPGSWVGLSETWMRNLNREEREKINDEENMFDTK